VPLKQAFSTLKKKWRSHRRLKVYLEYGTACLFCGLQATHLSWDKHLATDKKPHPNLWHIKASGQKIMMTVDHIIPRARGGSNHTDNLMPLCEKCNSKKGTRIAFCLLDTKQLATRHINTNYQDIKEIA